jgi:glycosyltransferase involved in cell wall biosynthesis
MAISEDRAGAPGSIPQEVGALPQPAHLYVDINPLLTRHLTGVGRFVARLVEALGRVCPLRLVGTLNPDFPRRIFLDNALIRGQELHPTAADLPGPREDLADWVKRLLRSPRQVHDVELARRSAGLFTFLRPAERVFGHEIGLLHDFVPIILPWTQAEETRDLFHSFCSERVALYDRLIANSQSTKAEAHWLCDVPDERIVVSYPGPSLCASCHSHPGPVAREAHLIVIVATREPRKNLDFVLDWFRYSPVLAPESELCWVGVKGWWTSQIPAAASADLRTSAPSLSRRIQFLGMIPDDQLCALYRRAAFTMCPSLYEGFGFPVLDSLRHGAPVLCSYNSALQEFAGPGVFFFDPYDGASLDLAYRELMASRPLAIARPDLESRCSWEGMARTVLKLSA